MTLSVPRENATSSVVCNSLGLNALLDTVRSERSCSILDLGPALEENVQFWSQFSCRLYIQDFYRSYQDRKATASQEKASDKAAFSVLLPFNDDTVFDIILAWDLFNYFELKQLELLIRRLRRWCRRGSKIFMLISSLPDISASPTKFRILNRKQMIYETPTRAKRLCPRYQPRDIARLMERFTVSGSFLLRHGIQEYVFTFK